MKKRMFMVWSLLVCVGLLSPGCMNIGNTSGCGFNPNRPNMEAYDLYYYRSDLFNAYRDAYLLLPRGSVVYPGDLFYVDLQRLPYFVKDGYVPLRIEVRSLADGSIIDVRIIEYYIPYTGNVHYLVQDIGPPVKKK